MGTSAKVHESEAIRGRFMATYLRNATRHFILGSLLLATTSVKAQDSRKAAFVLPPVLSAGQPFTFAVQGAVEGEVVTVQTVEGEVVVTNRADQHGRVFLASGLVAGTYLLTVPGAGAQRSVQVLAAPANDAHIRPMGRLCKVDEPLLVSSDVRCPDARSLVATIAESDVPVLASNGLDLVLSPPAHHGIVPGRQSIVVRNSQGALVASQSTTLCQIGVRLTHSKVVSGSTTALEFTMKPEGLTADVRATVLAGPVRFNTGVETDVHLRDSRASVPVETLAGQSGKFQIGWMLMPDGYQPPDEDPRTKKIREELDAKRRKTHVNSDGSKTIEQKDEKGRVVEKQKVSKTGEETYYESHQFDENGIDRFEQKVEVDGKGNRKHRIVRRNAKGQVVSDEECTYDKDGNHTGGTRTTTDKDGKSKTETYDPETNTWN